MLLLRVQLPSVPGSLGTLASALGGIGADISLVEIVERHGQIEVDELILELPPLLPVESLVATCDRLPGVEVHWVRNYPRGGGIDLDIALQRQMAADPARAGEILVAAAPLVFRARWALLLSTSVAPHVIIATSEAPPVDREMIRRFEPLTTLHRVVLGPEWHPEGTGHAVVAPLSPQQAVVVGRLGEPPFFRSELVRLAHLTGQADSGPALRGRPGTADLDRHRTPVAPPLYARPVAERSPPDGRPPGSGRSD